MTIRYSPDFPNFNPRSRVGSDHLQSVQLNVQSDFNPRSRVGSDGSTEPDIGVGRFQSTLPCRERPSRRRSIA